VGEEEEKRGKSAGEEVTLEKKNDWGLEWGKSTSAGKVEEGSRNTSLTEKGLRSGGFAITKRNLYTLQTDRKE